MKKSIFYGRRWINARSIAKCEIRDHTYKKYFVKYIISYDLAESKQVI